MSTERDKPLKTQQSVSLRPVDETDLEAIFAHQSDSIANQLAQFPPRDREAFFKHWHGNILGQGYCYTDLSAIFAFSQFKTPLCPCG